MTRRYGTDSVAIQDLLTILFFGRLDIMRKKLRSNSYNNGKEDFDFLFNVYDRKSTNHLTSDDFQRAVRKFTKVTVADMPDAELMEVFGFINKGGDGITREEWHAFLTPPSQPRSEADVIFAQIYGFTVQTKQKPVDLFR